MEPEVLLIIFIQNNPGKIISILVDYKPIYADFPQHAYSTYLMEDILVPLFLKGNLCQN